MKVILVEIRRVTPSSSISTKAMMVKVSNREVNQTSAMPSLGLSSVVLIVGPSDLLLRPAHTRPVRLRPYYASLE